MNFNAAKVYQNRL